jgi:hypothetical protein
MSWFKRKPRVKPPERHVAHRASPMQDKHMEKIKQQQKEDLPSKKTDKE